MEVSAAIINLAILREGNLDAATPFTKRAGILGSRVRGEAAFAPPPSTIDGSAHGAERLVEAGSEPFVAIVAELVGVGLCTEDQVETTKSLENIGVSQSPLGQGHQKGRVVLLDVVHDVVERERGLRGRS